MKFANGKELYEYFCNGKDLYSKSEGIYAFEYNDAHAICVYHLHPEEVIKLIQQHKESDEYWGAYLGSGGKILDDINYNEYRYAENEEKRNLYLKPTLEFSENMYMVHDWMDTNEVTIEYIINKSNGNSQ